MVALGSGEGSDISDIRSGTARSPEHRLSLPVEMIELVELVVARITCEKRVAKKEKRQR